MISRSRRSKQRDTALSALDGFIQALSVAKDTCGVPPAQIALAAACILLTTIKNTMDNKDGYIDLGLSCADVCEALDRGLNGKRSDNLSKPVQKGIEKLTTTVANIQRRVNEKNGRGALLRALHAQNDKDMIAAWKGDLDRLLHIFNTELAIDTNIKVTDNHQEVTSRVTDMHREVTSRFKDMHRDVLVIKQNVSNKQSSNQASVLGESPYVLLLLPALLFLIHLFARKIYISQPEPLHQHALWNTSLPSHAPHLPSLPPAPKAFFGRDTLVEEVVSLAERFEPIALIGAGGIGKTSIALAVLHHDRIKNKFGDNRRFLRCDRFTPSLSNFLAQLSEATGAGIENPDDFDSLRPFLSSEKMILFLDNAESILDPQGIDAREIYTVVEELGRFDNICLGITSRIRTVPPHCKRPVIPTLSVESACQIFYSIYNDGGQSDIIRDLVGRLDFHALSITLIATAAAHNAWDYNQLLEEWNTQRARVLQTDHDQSLAASIELSLASPMFRKLGPSARELLGVIAFFPQGVDRNNLEWLFPTIPDVKSTFDKFCTLSLTYRSSNFFTMLAPIRDYLAPNNPMSSPLLCKTKDHYITRLLVQLYPGAPGVEETGWIVSEDVNVEHLLDTFTSFDANTGDIWDACSKFMEYLRWNKPRKTVLGVKIEGLPDDHPSKSTGLFDLSELYNEVGNHPERKRLLTQVLKLEKKRGCRPRIAQTLSRLSDANRWLHLYEEGIQLAWEALEIYEQLGDRTGQMHSLNALALILYHNDQLDDATAAAFHGIDLALEEGQGLFLCESHRTLGLIYQRKGQKEEAIYHHEAAISIAFLVKWAFGLFWNHYALAELFLYQAEFDKANTHIEEARPHAVNNRYHLARAMGIQAEIWYGQDKLEDAKLEASRALEVFEKLGAADDAKRCRDILQRLDTQVHEIHHPTTWRMRFKKFVMTLGQ